MVEFLIFTCLMTGSISETRMEDTLLLASSICKPCKHIRRNVNTFTVYIDSLVTNHKD